MIEQKRENNKTRDIEREIYIYIQRERRERVFMHERVIASESATWRDIEKREKDKALSVCYVRRRRSIMFTASKYAFLSLFYSLLKSCLMPCTLKRVRDRTGSTETIK